MDNDMIPVSLEDTDESHLQQLVDDAVVEAKTIEYKRELNPDSKKHKEKFLAEITSFANARGGDLILGMDENDDGEPGTICGMDIDNVDKTIDRWGNIARMNVNPRLPSMETKPITINNERTVLVVRTQQSWRSPHRVTTSDKFYGRSSNGKYPLDVHEIRDEILLSETNAEEIREFRADRIAKIRADDTPVSLYEYPRLVLHLIPINTFTPNDPIDITTIPSSDAPGTFRRQPLTLNVRYNIDGIVKYWEPNNEEKSYGYTQTFRSGCIEAVDTMLLREKDKENVEDRRYIPSTALREYFEYSLDQYLTFLQSEEISPPIFVFVTILDAEGYFMWKKQRPYQNQIDRDVVLIPEQSIEKYSQSTEECIDNCINAIWNAAGYPKEQSGQR